jgi:nucleoside-diphosphate-sugar epimerase
MRILLIGGNGFIGRFVVAALQQQGHAVAVFHRGTTAAPQAEELMNIFRGATRRGAWSC